ncbi:hypothetical protein SEA_ATUIN_74 [Arthrobacter phage Atuin]|nr:hypothetical protein SEA_ATUIN_173 [Arthrobacter phage Atuin]
MDDLSLEGDTLANDYHWRSTKAKKQLRDRFGRWIALGANVRWRKDGQEQAGVVTSVVDGKAYVDRKNEDGTTTEEILTPRDLRVLASKATLPLDGETYKDEGNDFEKALKTPEVNDILEQKKQVRIEGANGYMLTAQEKKPKDETNPWLYQLFAPGGRSLGQYASQDSIPMFNGMVEEDQAAESPEGGEAPAAGEAPAGEAPAAPAGGVTASGEAKPFRVPETIRTAISAALSTHAETFSADDIETATRLANDDSVSLSDVKWIHQYFESTDPYENLRGGFKGRKWASKIVDPESPDMPVECADGHGHPKYMFDDDAFAYFAIGNEFGSTIAYGLISVDYESGSVYTWGPEGFALDPTLDMATVDHPQITPVDEMTAEEVARWIDGNEAGINLVDIFPEERNLYNAASSELDYDEIDASFAIIADASGYTPFERSLNAKKQKRAGGGKFGEEPDAIEAPEEEAAPVVKARLPYELPIVPDPAARIAEFISTAAEAPVVAAGEPVEEAPAPEYDETDQATEDAATGPKDEAIYFAIVDEIDKTAVMDAFSIVKKNGQPEAWLRQNGQWVLSPDTLANLTGSTPPTVVEMDIPEPVKTVLAQIDSHDAGGDTIDAPTAEELPQEGEVAIAASGFSRPDGSFRILDVEDLKEAVLSAGDAPDIFVKAHIRKRARALNRLDIVPVEWREFTLAEKGELSAAETVFGEFGEIPVVASGVPGVSDTPLDYKNAMKLQNYWTRGKGALKIRWGTKGDLTRAHRHLAKYVGMERAWGLAQKYHHSLYGVYNYTHDVATGQHSPRGKK